MMRTEYKRDMNHNYLILHGDEQIDTNSYQVRILIGNGMPSLLKCRIQGIDGKFMIYYDITSRQSVASLYEKKKLGLEDLRLIFGGFVQVMEEMAEYLMNPGQLLVQPEYMYLDVEKGKMYFCCMPGNGGDIREQFRVLTEYILPKIDHEDGAAVILGYGVYRRALEDTFHLEYIKEEIYKGREGNVQEIQSEKLFQETKEQQENFWKKEQNSFENRDEEKEQKVSFPVWKKILFCFLGAFILLLVSGAVFLGFIPGVRAEFVLGGGVIFMGGGMLAYVVIKKQRQQKNSRQKEEKLFSVEQERAEELQLEKREAEAHMEIQDQEKAVQDAYKEAYTSVKDFGETVVLSANTVEGPATLVSREPGELATIYLQEEMTVIGKMKTAVDAVIDLPTVSRIHAKIRKRDNQYYLSDLNSRNGTVVNGRLLKEGEECLLNDEDEVDFAQARYIFLK